MADFTFDVGDCHPIVQPVTEIQRGVQTPIESPFQVGRRIYERGWRIVELSWAAVDLGVVWSLLDHFNKTSGGVLTMDYTPDNGEAAYEIRFAQPIEYRQVSGLLYSISVLFWQRIDQ